MKAKKRKARSYWIVESSWVMPKAEYTKKAAIGEANERTFNGDDGVEIIKVTEQLPKRRVRK